MYFSPYATSVTRKHVAGERLNDIQPDPTNYKALEKGMRTEAWKARTAKK